MLSLRLNVYAPSKHDELAFNNFKLRLSMRMTFKIQYGEFQVQTFKQINLNFSF
jgi:hypothetical protein